MKNKILLTLAIFISTWGPGCVEIAHAGNGSGNVSNVAVVGATPTAPLGLANIPPSSIGGTGGYFTISAGPGVTRSSDHVMPFRKDGVLYQVSSGKTAYCFAITIWSAVASIKYQLMSDTVTFANDALAGSLTAPVYQGGVSTNYGIIAHVTNSSIPDPYAGTYSFGSLTWPGVQQSTSDMYNLTAVCSEK